MIELIPFTSMSRLEMWKMDHDILCFCVWRSMLRSFFVSLEDTHACHVVNQVGSAGYAS